MDDNPLHTYQTLQQEIIQFNPDLGLKPYLICRSKMDLITENLYPWQDFNQDVLDISAISGVGLDLLISKITGFLHEID